MKTLLALLLLLGATSCQAQDILQPETGVLSEFSTNDQYLVMVREHLIPDPNSSLARMVCLPSFWPEWAVTVRQVNKTTCFIDYAEAARPLWGANQPSKVKTMRADVPIDPQTATLVHAVWLRALLQVRQPQTVRLGFDGTFFHFSCLRDGGGGVLSGKVWSPDPPAITHDLVALGIMLRNYVKAKPVSRPALARALRQSAVVVKGQLDARQQQN